MIVGFAMNADLAMFVSFVEAKDEQAGEPKRDGGVLGHGHFPVLLMHAGACSRARKTSSAPPKLSTQVVRSPYLDVTGLTVRLSKRTRRSGLFGAFLFIVEVAYLSAELFGLGQVSSRREYETWNCKLHI
jgi:hypothetical protein